MYKLGLEGIKVDAPLGVYEWEKQQGRSYELNVEMMLDVDIEKIGDDLSQTLNYEDVIRLIEDRMGAECDLIENKLVEIGEALLKEFPLIIELKLRINKLDPMQNAKLRKSFVERMFKQT
jgi:dihydroneopterin aldolase